VEYAQFLLTVADANQRLSPDNQSDFARTIRVVRPVDRLLALLKDSSGRFPEQPIWLILEGNLLTLNGKPADAHQRYSDAFRISGENPQVATTYLNSLLIRKEFEEVINLTTRLMGKTPQYGDYYIKRGAAFANLGKKQEAMNDFAQAMTLAGQDMELYLTVIRQAGKVARDEMVAHLNERIKANPGDAASRIGLGELYLSRGQGSEGAAVLAPLMEHKDAPYRKTLLKMMGMGKYLSKDFEGANLAYTELLTLTPNDLEVLNNLSFLLAEELGRPKDGLKHAEKAVKILQSGNVDLSFVNNGNVYDTYGWVLFLSGNVPGGIMELRRALQIEPSPIAYYHLARALLKNRPADVNGAKRAVSDGIRLASQTRDPALSQLETLKKEIGAE
jgi:tetratricopeptide (TPR) repeat protein